MPLVNCAYCGKELNRAAHRLKASSRQFCNYPCYHAHLKTLTGDKNRDFRRIAVNCAQCGKSLNRVPYEIWQNDKHFCDTSCYTIYQRGGATTEDCTVLCQVCGKEMERSPSHIQASKGCFCGAVCYGKWLSETNTGANNPTWKGGSIHYYGPNWRAQKRKARQRDNHTCRNCGRKHKKGERLFDVHHIRAFREFGYKPNENDSYLQANDLGNLVTLCAYCHILVEHGHASFQLNLL